MYEFKLTEDEVIEIKNSIVEIVKKYESIDSIDLIKELNLYSQELPRRLRSSINDYRLDELGDGAFLIRGYPVDQVRIGPTPSSWDQRNNSINTIHEEAFLVLCGSLLGDPFAWASQQKGFMTHEVIPLKEHETSQLGWGSNIELIWHVEDAFSPFSPDYLALMCMRNPELTGTTIGAMSDLDLDKLDLDTLFGKNYTIKPDEAHLPKNMAQDCDITQEDIDLVESYSRREHQFQNPEKIALLYGDRTSPYIRVDPYYMGPCKDDKSQKALDELLDALAEKKKLCKLEPGDVVVIDNLRVVHGRDNFVAKYDGTDRWLKRINITRDIRKSRASRSSSTSRVIY